MNEIHGHEVLKMMTASAKAYTRDSPEADIVAQFGADTRFYTCSAQNLSARELIDFLEARGKFVPRTDGFNTSPDLMCGH